MICPQCGERDERNIASVRLGNINDSRPGHACVSCGCQWEMQGVKPVESPSAIDEIDKAVDEIKPPKTWGEALERAKGPGLLTGAPDELPGIKAAVAGGDMDFMTDERARWLIHEIELAREVIAEARKPLGEAAETSDLEDVIAKYDAPRRGLSEYIEGHEPTCKAVQTYPTPNEAECDCGKVSHE